MHINIELEQKDSKTSGGLVPMSPQFKIEIAELLDAIKNCYTQLGTIYDPIKIDNFVTVGGNAFSSIDKGTTVSVSLSDLDGDCQEIVSHKLVCCMLTIVDKKFIDSGELADKENWMKIFEDSDFLDAAPDGTLYISPDEKGKCNISSKKAGNKAEDIEWNIAYSILMSLSINLDDQDIKRVYFILDPLVKISSNQGTNPPNNIIH